ncbi:MAG: peptidoglycan-binding LysM [Gammaproteobacteria bacterium CG22_combo_CG10-13_8_21_14_all_40_8]|nr:MAG: peptidoglycan-binding LysM [Gammaproteobacteria bacterium CG22_combo_CG10-13_8_21_14_all_40_8]
MKIWLSRILWALVIFSTMTFNARAEVELKPNHPDVYVVKKSDTLWDISAMFLSKPWLWPEIWQANPQISNPHLIYPGDVLSLVYIDGKPQIVLNNGVIKLSPKVREVSRGEAIYSLPLAVIKPFLVGARVVSEKELDTAPYLVATDGEHLVASQGTRFYARDVDQANVQTGYALFRKGKEFIDPVTSEFLGFEAVHLGEADLVRLGDPSTFDITKSVEESRAGDRLMPVKQDYLLPYFFPHRSGSDIEGQILSVYEGVTQIGQYNVVVINRGTREGVEVGHVLTVWHKGAIVKDAVSRERRRNGDNYSILREVGDTFKGGNKKDLVTLPDEEAGDVMVFRTFEKVSLALVVNATRPLYILDRVKNPY